MRKRTSEAEPGVNTPGSERKNVTASSVKVIVTPFSYDPDDPQQRLSRRM